MSERPRILTLDIETSPHLSWHFDTYRVDIRPIQVVEPSRIICVAAKWHDQKKVMFVSEWQMGHAEMIQTVRDWLDEADVVVTYNGDNFDLPHLRWAMDLHGVERPSPFVSVDLYKVLKREYKKAPVSKSLDYLTRRLSLTGKLAHEGYFPLWLKMNGSDPEKALRVFTRYNKRDVVTTEELFDLSEHLVPNIPAAALYDDSEDVQNPGLTCPAGHTEFTRQGYKRTKTRRYPQYKCSVCGRWFSETRSDFGVSSA